jgi:hypothetical protein
MPHLRVILGHQAGRVFPLKPGTNSIGRDSSSSIVLAPDSPASRRHAEISSADGEWEIRDLGSSNGTKINGSLVNRKTLDHHDEIIVGENVMVFEYSDRATADTEAAASAAIHGDANAIQNDPEFIAIVRSLPSKLTLLERAFAAYTPPRALLIRQIVIAILAGGNATVFGVKEDAIPAGLRRYGIKAQTSGPWSDTSTGSTSFEDSAFGIEGTSVVLEGEIVSDPERFVSRNEIEFLKNALTNFHISESQARIAARMVCATRPESKYAPDMVKQCVETGATSESAFHLLTAAKARAICKGRTKVELSDLERVAPMALLHRMRPTSNSLQTPGTLDATLSAIIATAFDAV